MPHKINYALLSAQFRLIIQQYCTKRIIIQLAAKNLSDKMICSVEKEVKKEVRDIRFATDFVPSN
jgi:hypothetical protein